MDQRDKIRCKLNLFKGIAKANYNSLKYLILNPKPSDLIVNRLKSGETFWRIELFSVATEWDDLRLGVKG